MLAWVRYSISIFAGGLVVAFVEEQSLEGLRSLEMEDAVHFGRAPDWCLLGGFGPKSEQGASPCLLEIFGRDQSFSH